MKSKIITTLLFLALALTGFGQITITCHDDEMIDKKTNIVDPNGDELFSGVILETNGRRRKLYAPIKTKLQSVRWFELVDAYGNGARVDVNRIFGYNTKEALLDFLSNCPVTASGIENDPIFSASPAANLTQLNIDTFNLKQIAKSYDDLRGGVFKSPVVVKNHFTIFGGVAYETIGGVFYKVESGSENGGTIIVSEDGSIWERSWDGVNIYANWWGIGGYDINGRIYEDDFEFDGVQFTGCRFKQAASFSSPGSNIILGPSDLYEVAQDIGIKSGVTLIGNNSTIKRLPVQTELTQESTIGTNYYYVIDASMFRVGMQVNAFGSVNHGDQSHTTPSFSMVVSSVVGNRINLTQNVSKTIPQGSKVCLTDELIRSNPEAENT